MKVPFASEELCHMTPEKLTEILLQLSEENSELQSALDKLQTRYDQQAKDMLNVARAYSDLETERDTLKKENARLEKELEHAKETAAVYARLHFKTGTETVPVVNMQTDDDMSCAETMDSAKVPVAPEDTSDPTPNNKNEKQEDGDGDIKIDLSTKLSSGKGNSGMESKPRGRSGPKEHLIRHAMMDLPQRDEFLLSPEEIQRLDNQYGPNNWRVAFWVKTSHMEVIPRLLYVQNDYRPVFEYSLNGVRELLRSDRTYFYPHSIYSPSLFASIVYDKYALALPVYRQMGAMNHLIGDSLERGNVSRVLIRAAQGCFMPVYQYMKERLLALTYSQSDETTIHVIEGGAEKTHYMWCHVTSELCPDDPQIVLFDFEKTRSAEHLRKYFSDGFVRIITSDCYVCYSTIESEKDSITISNCWVHCRRYFFVAYCMLTDVKGLSDEVLLNSDEFKFLSFIGKMFDADTPLKGTDPEIRLNVRQEIIKPIVDSFFTEAKKIDLNDSMLSEKLNSAVSYALNHEKQLRLFLDDPCIPIDNSNCERSIRSLAVGRRNWIFADSFDGAASVATYYTLVSTAIKNEADPFFYVKYLCERIPGGIDGPEPTVQLTKEFLESMMPWSETYRECEKEERMHLYSLVSFDSGEEPDIAAMRSAATSVA